MPRDRPSLTACLIVRDEAERLAGCLASLAGFVDEVVVADTGSVDDSPAIARSAGAQVLRVDWADHFAEARNQALAGCRTEWVLSVDADELAAGEASQLSELLRSCDGQLDALAVRIDNAAGPDGHGRSWHRELKLLRSGRTRWHGRVHERPVLLDGAELRCAELPAEALRLVHSGYGDPVIARAKAARNARLAALELQGLRDCGAGAAELARAALDLGRSELGCGRSELAVPALHQARSYGAGADPAAPSWAAWRWATDFLIRIALAAGQVEEAIVLVSELAESGAPGQYCDWLLAQALLVRGDTAAAEPLLLGITRLIDLGGSELDLAQVRAALAHVRSTG